MGGAGTAWAVPLFGASGGLRVFTSLVFPRARALNSNEDAPAALAPSKQQFGRSVGRDGEFLLCIGRHVGWKFHLSLASEGSRDLPKACPPDPRRGGGEVADALGQLSRSMGAQPYALSPFVAFLSISRLPFR